MRHSPAIAIAVADVLERQGAWLSRHAALSLATLTLLIGITSGFARELRSSAVERPSTAARCGSAEVDFHPFATAAGIRQLMAAAHALVTDGPDESGRFEVRFASDAGIRMLRASALVARVDGESRCQ